MFWFAALLLLLVVFSALLWPLLRKGAAAPSRAEHDVEVYGAQLRELEGDLGRGTIRADQAAGAKAEIGRRLLKAASEAERVEELRLSGGRTMLLAACLCVALAALGAVALYSRLGAPQAPDLPLEARLSVDPAKADLPTLVAQVEHRLKRDPDDGRGWDMLLPIYLRMGRGEDAVTAAGNAIRLLGATADREAMRGEAEMRAASGRVTDTAAAAFQKALDLDPRQPAARFYLALGLSQEQRFAQALPAWKAILDGGPPDAPWMAPARTEYENARARLAGTTAEPPLAPGPTSEQMAAAGKLSPQDRSAMISGMVSQLSARLKSAPNDPDGWKRLMRSYAVLGEPDKAREALMQAQALFAMGSQERRSIDDFAASLGLADTGTNP